MVCGACGDWYVWRVVCGVRCGPYEMHLHCRDPSTSTLSFAKLMQISNAFASTFAAWSATVSATLLRV